MNEGRDINGHYKPVENPLNWHPDLTPEQIMHMIGEKEMPIPEERYGGLGGPYDEALLEYGIKPGKPRDDYPDPEDDIVKDDDSAKQKKENLWKKLKKRLAEMGLIGTKKPRIKIDDNKKEDEEKIDDFQQKPTENVPRKPIGNVPRKPIGNVPKRVPTAEEISGAIKGELGEDAKNVIVKVTKKQRSFAIPLIAVSLAALIASGFSLEDDYVILKEEVTTSQDNLNYQIDQVITPEKAMKLIMHSINLGDYMKLVDGMQFNTNSWMSGVRKELGDEFNNEGKFVGNYPITGFSVVRKGDDESSGYIQDFDEKDLEGNLGEFVDEVLKDKGLNLEDVDVVLHFGRTTDSERTRLGWIDLISVVPDEVIADTIENSATYGGTIEDFKGDYITIDTEHGKVNIPVKDSEGNYVKNGDIVIGSDNQSYEISNFDIEEVSSVTEKLVEVNDGKKLTFSFKNIDMLAGLPLLLVAADYIRRKKMDREAAKTPYYKKVTSEQLDAYVDDFKKAKYNSGDIFSYHRGKSFKEDDIKLIAKRAYEKKTGVIVDNINDLFIDVRQSRIAVWKRGGTSGFVDITEEVTEFLGSNKFVENYIGDGYDKDAESYFNANRGRGGR